MDKHELADLEPEPGIVLRYRRTAIIFMLVVAVIFIPWGSLGVLAWIQGKAPFYQCGKGALISLMGAMALFAVTKAIIQRYSVILGDTKLQLVAGGSRIMAQLPYYNIASIRVVKSRIDGKKTLELAIADQDDYQTVLTKHMDKKLVEISDVFVVPLDQVMNMIEKKRQKIQKKGSGRQRPR
jgi:hypothetical protein